MCHHSQSESIEWEKEFEKFWKDSSILTEGYFPYRDDVRGFISQAITTAVAKDRQRILGLPCMKEEGREFVPWASCESDEAYAAGKKDGANFLRRELKEEINI